MNVYAEPFIPKAKSPTKGPVKSKDPPPSSRGEGSPPDTHLDKASSQKTNRRNWPPRLQALANGGTGLYRLPEGDSTKLKDPKASPLKNSTCSDTGSGFKGHAEGPDSSQSINNSNTSRIPQPLYPTQTWAHPDAPAAPVSDNNVQHPQPSAQKEGIYEYIMRERREQYPDYRTIPILSDPENEVYVIDTPTGRYYCGGTVDVDRQVAFPSDIFPDEFNGYEIYPDP